MFLRNGWYPVMWASAVEHQPIARTVLDERIVLFRTSAGRVVVFEDRCCHRAAPLSRGKVVGEHLVCGYHGLRFAETGACVEIPGQAQVPPGAAVRSYPVVEK